MAKRRKKKGRTSQINRFKRAAKKCSKQAKKRKGSYRACMKRELRK